MHYHNYIDSVSNYLHGCLLKDLQETNSNESRVPSDTAADAVTVASLSLEMPSVSSESAACNSGEGS